MMTLWNFKKPERYFFGCLFSHIVKRTANLLYFQGYQKMLEGVASFMHRENFLLSLIWRYGTVGSQRCTCSFWVYRVMLICANHKCYGELPKHTSAKRGSHVIGVLAIVRLKNRCMLRKHPCRTVLLLKSKCICCSKKRQYTVKYIRFSNSCPVT